MVGVAGHERGKAGQAPESRRTDGSVSFIHNEGRVSPSWLSGGLIPNLGCIRSF